MLIAVSTTGWTVLAVVYVLLLVSLGVMAIRKGHWVMFILGIFFPLFWIIGAMLPPTEDAARSATAR